LALLTTIGQEKAFPMIIKSFMTLSFIILIDNHFGNILPAAVYENATELNKSQLLEMGEDNNTFAKIFKRSF